VKIFAVSVIVLSLTVTYPAYARNIKLILPIAAAMEARDFESRPTGAVKFFFGTQKSPEILTKLGSYAATPRSAAMGMLDEKACNGAFLWTLVALEKRAQQLGANAVVNIVSFYQKNEMSSTTEFECHVGNVIASVFLKGDFVKIANP
jgi:uncharacterized protein YbjQ (UPF0145 family)